MLLRGNSDTLGRIDLHCDANGYILIDSAVSDESTTTPASSLRLKCTDEGVLKVAVAA